MTLYRIIIIYVKVTQISLSATTEYKQHMFVKHGVDINWSCPKCDETFDKKVGKYGNINHIKFQNRKEED